MHFENLPAELRCRLEDELNSGESVRWSAQPDPRRMSRTSWPMVLFGLVWTAFSLFWVWGAAGFGQPDRLEGGWWLFPLFGVPFVLIGLAMLASPFVLHRKARATVYAITDRRAILIEGGWGLSIRSLAPRSLDDQERRQRADGSGDIIFKRESSRFSDRGSFREVGFFGIPEVKRVQGMLRTLHDEAAGEGAR